MNMLDKKLIALMMTGALVFGGSFSAIAAEAEKQAETEEVVEYDFTRMDEEFARRRNTGVRNGAIACAIALIFNMLYSIDHHPDQ